MPLIQSPSKKAFQKNVKTEMEANPSKKDRAQNLAIAYGVQRKNRKAKGGVVSFGPDRHPHSTGRYAEGGMAEMPEPVIQTIGKELYLDEDEKASDKEASRDHKDMYRVGDKSYAEGGSVDSDASVASAQYDKPGKRDLGAGYTASIAGPKTAHLHKEGKYLDTVHPSDIERRVAEHKKGNYADGGQIQRPQPPTPPQPTSMDDFVSGFKKATHYYSGGKILHDEMPDETDPRAGMERSMDHDEMESEAERHRDQSMKMAHGGMYRRKMAEGGFAEPEWAGAGTLGFPMMEQENDPDEYSKEGIINYARGGDVAMRDAHRGHYNEVREMPAHMYAMGGMTAEEQREMPEPTSQRLGEEDYLDDMEMPISRHGAGQGEYEASRSFAQENPSIADTIRKKYMASGGRAMMASGGYANEEAIDKGLDQNAVEHTNYMYKLNRQLADNEDYSEMNALQDIDMAQDDRDDGGQDSRDIPMDRYDMVDEIRKKYARNRSI
jgi:hypothetical protein